MQTPMHIITMCLIGLSPAFFNLSVRLERFEHFIIIVITVALVPRRFYAKDEFETVGY